MLGDVEPALSGQKITHLHQAHGVIGVAKGERSQRRPIPADADHSQYYLPDESQPEKGTVADAAQCLKACQADESCVVWTFKPGRFGSPNSCKLSPQLMHEQGIKTPFAGAASGVVE